MNPRILARYSSLSGNEIWLLYEFANGTTLCVKTYPWVPPSVVGAPSVRTML